MSKNSKRKKRQEQYKIREKELSQLLQRAAASQPEKKTLAAHPAVMGLRISYVILGGIVTIFSLYSAMVYIWPNIEVAPGQTLDPRSPFETRFVLKNNSALPIYNVVYSTTWSEGNPNLGYIKMPNLPQMGIAPMGFSWPTDKISHNGIMTIKIIASPIPESPPPIPRSKTAALLITINYEYPWFLKWKQRRQTFQFFTAADKNGDYQWFVHQVDVPDTIWKPGQEPHIDIYEPDVPQPQQIHQIDTMPYVDMAAVNVENNFTNDHSTPVKIIYSLTNIGGMPAVNPTVDWKIWDLRGPGPKYTRWDNLWVPPTNSSTTPFFMLSGQIIQKTDFWQDDERGLVLYNQVMNGNFDLVATLTFQDVDHHIFDLVYKIVPSTNGFIPSYRACGGYFTNLVPNANITNNPN